MHAIRLLLLAVFQIALCVQVAAADPRWEKLAGLEHEMAAAQARTRELKAFLTCLGETVPAGADAALDAARARLQAATQARKVAPGLADLEARCEAATAERTARIDAILAGSARYQELLATQRKAAEIVQALAPRLTGLVPDEARRYAQARADEDAAAGELYRIRKVYWDRGEVAPAQAKVDDLYKKVQAARNPKGGDEEGKELAQARAALREAQVAAVAGGLGKAEADELAGLEKAIEDKRAQQQAVRQELQVAWTTCKVQRPAPPKAAAKADDKPKMLNAAIEIPAGCQQIRGLLFSFMGTVHGDLLVRAVLAENGFALVTMDGLGIFTGEDERATLMAFLDQLAEKSGHPEVAQAPWLPTGCSTTTITARNMAAWKPERTLGVILWAGGNLHQHQSIPGWSLAGIPVLNINGEWEVYGPEGGGKGGIQPAYGRLTQWLMIREQIQRLRAQDPAHLFSLVVLPGGDHAQWSPGLSPLAALFVRKAIQARLPAPGGPPTCRPVAPESGWLSDPDLYEPKLPAAPLASYAGPPAKAFWHLDQEMAEAVDAFHRGRFFLPDPSREHPVPADWPPVRKPAAAPAGSP